MTPESQQQQQQQSKQYPLLLPTSMTSHQLSSTETLLLHLTCSTMTKLPLVAIAANKNATKMYTDCMNDIYTRINIEISTLVHQRKKNIVPVEITDEMINTIEMEIQDQTKEIIKLMDSIIIHVKHVPTNIKSNTIKLFNEGRKDLDKLVEKNRIAENFLTIHSQHLDLKIVPKINISLGIPANIAFRGSLTNNASITSAHKENLINPSFKIILENVELLANGKYNPDKYNRVNGKLTLQGFRHNYFNDATSNVRHNRNGTNVLMKFLTRLYPYWNIKSTSFKKDAEIESLLDTINLRLINYYKNKNGKTVIPRIFNKSTGDFQMADERLQLIIFLLQYGPICSTLLT